MKNMGGKTSGGFFARLSQFFSSEYTDADAAPSPLLEMLEPRLLMSATPLSDLVDNDYPQDAAAPAAVYMPLAAGTTDSADNGIAVQAADVEAPVIQSVVSNVTGYQTFTNTTFTITATDNVKVTRYTLTINGENVAVTASTGKSANYKFTEAGTYAVVATAYDAAYDAAGNAGSYAFAIEVAECPDVKAPTFTISGVANNSSKNSDIPLKISVSDADSLVINWSVSLRNNDTGETRLLGAGDRAISSSSMPIALNDYPEGSYTLLVEAVDKGGNRSEKEINFRIDTTPPEVRVEHGRLEAEQDVWFAVVGEDASAITSRMLYINGRGIKLDANGRGSYSFAAPGEYTLSATVKDAAGNSTTITEMLVVTENTDFIAPTITINSPSVNSYVKDSVDIHAVIGDVDSDDVSWTVRIRLSNGTTVRTVATGTGPIINLTATQLGSSGVCTLEIEAIDPAGNSSIATKTFNVVKTGPKVRMDPIDYDYDAGTRKWINGAKTVTATITPGDVPAELVSWTMTAMDVETKEVFIVASGTGAQVSATFTPPHSGRYSITVTAMDCVANSASWSETIYADILPPMISDIDFKTTDNLFFLYYIDGLDDMEEIEGQTGGPYSIMRDVETGHGIRVRFNSWGGKGFSNMPIGVYTYEITVYDGHGNSFRLGQITVERTQNGLIVGPLQR